MVLFSISSKSSTGLFASIRMVIPFNIAISSFAFVFIILSTTNIISLLYDSLPTMSPFFYFFHIFILPYRKNLAFYNILC